MKKFTPFFVFIFLVYLSNAQPSILYENMPEAGFTSPISAGAEIPVGSPGANQTWDFSGLVLNSVGSWSIVDPSSTPYYSNFPASNFVYAIEVFGETAYNYSLLQPGFLESLGEDWTSEGGKSYLPDPKTVLVFPFNYQEVIEDAWERTDGESDTVVRTYDAYGTLIVPFGTFNNVVRVTTTGSASNTAFYNTDPVYTILQVDHENGITVAFTDALTGLDENEPESLSIYPNPVVDQLHIQSSSKICKVEVLNLAGQQLISTNDGGSQVDMSWLQSGIYLVRMTDARGDLVNKMIYKQ